jgi:hypothetical protein
MVSGQTIAIEPPKFSRDVAERGTIQKQNRTITLHRVNVVRKDDENIVVCAACGPAT